MNRNEYKTSVAELGCIACYLRGIEDVPCQLHHPRYCCGMGQRADDYLVVGLCAAHHLDGGIGVAFHAGPRTFQKNFLSEPDLVRLTRKRLVEAGYNVEGLPSP